MWQYTKDEESLVDAAATRDTPLLMRLVDHTIARRTAVGASADFLLAPLAVVCTVRLGSRAVFLAPLAVLYGFTCSVTRTSFVGLKTACSSDTHCEPPPPVHWLV